MKNYIKQLNEEKVSASVLQEYTIRLKQIEDKLDNGLIIPTDILPRLKSWGSLAGSNPTWVAKPTTPISI